MVYSYSTYSLAHKLQKANSIRGATTSFPHPEHSIGSLQNGDQVAARFGSSNFGLSWSFMDMVKGIVKLCCCETVMHNSLATGSNLRDFHLPQFLNRLLTPFWDHDDWLPSQFESLQGTLFKD
ncbi:hypothetical protein VNO77_21759 [Canavalia gladiata]|uniref:Uncharacterized protein n=1 Tax=Canavalia gladiata TaxID=3824 RepID=A0AAN9L4L2_CANGL